jgi:hypothetical protein
MPRQDVQVASTEVDWDKDTTCLFRISLFKSHEFCRPLVDKPDIPTNSKRAYLHPIRFHSIDERLP